jgi:hypothetical protein
MPKAENMALLAAIEAVARGSHVALIDGLPLLEWYKKHRLIELDKVLISLEDADPSLAAALQAKIDQARKEQP